MNNPGDDINAGLHQRLSRRRNFQLLRDIVTSYNENIRVNNQYMIEYIQSMQDIINYMRDMNNRDELYYEQLRRTRPRRPPPPPPSPRTHFNPINGHHSVPVTPPNRNIRNMSLGEFIQGIAQDTETTPVLSTETDNNNNNRITSMRTFTTFLDGEFSSNQNITISNLYRIMMRDFTETGVTQEGLDETELEYGVIDVTYNAASHGIIDTHCPIILEDFEDNERIKQIVECGHIFKPEPLLRWFSLHTECPICRCDLKMNRESRDASFNFTPNTNTDIIDDIEPVNGAIPNSLGRTNEDDGDSD
jgi:hypothetical protein